MYSWSCNKYTGHEIWLQYIISNHIREIRISQLKFEHSLASGYQDQDTTICCSFQATINNLETVIESNLIFILCPAMRRSEKIRSIEQIARRNRIVFMKHIDSSVCVWCVCKHSFGYSCGRREAEDFIQNMIAFQSLYDIHLASRPRTVRRSSSLVHKHECVVLTKAIRAFWCFYRIWL